MKELEVTLSIANNRLKERRIEAGLTRGALCDLAHIPDKSVYGQLEKAKISPLRKDDSGWTVPAQRLIDFWGVLPEELFPTSVLSITEPEVAMRLDGLDMADLLTSSQQLRLESPEALAARADVIRVVSEELDKLPPGWAAAARGMAEGRTLASVAKEQGVSRERIRQCRESALRRLRSPSVIGRLKEINFR